MVGHTGNLQAAIEAVSVTDECVGELLQAVDQVEGRFLLTADHGNAEDMVQVTWERGAGCHEGDNRCGGSDTIAFCTTIGMACVHLVRSLTYQCPCRLACPSATSRGSRW
jgi:hypothetical protein